MGIDALYPPAPRDVPPDITRLPNAYRLRVFAMVAGLFIFLAIYLALIAATAWLAHLIWTIEPARTGSGRGSVVFIILKLGGLFALLLLLLFLVKGLFKSQRPDRSMHIELKEEDHPALFAFIHKVVEDTQSQPPRRVVVSPEVNAGLIYSTSLLSLIIPPKKDLHIGLGLVNVVNLSEFKAVLAHEFGHFAQSSVGLQNYLYVANKVMHDMIYHRDGLDRLVDKWSTIDIFVSFPAWGLKAAFWIVRLVLGGIYRGLNLLHLSLSRQMEYNADNVAVSVAGSDAIVHSLCRIEFASLCLQDAGQSLDAAADHGVFTDDLFLHQTKAADRLRKLRKEPRAGLPPELPKDPREQVKVFEPVHDGIPDRYRSHPTDEMREKNAKRFYIRSPQDNRSPWLLFRNVAALKRHASELVYKNGLERKEPYDPRPAAEVQQFIDAEHAEATYDPRYHGLFDDRFINPGEIDGVEHSLWPFAQAAGWLDKWPGAGIEEQAKAFRTKQEEMELLNALQTGELVLKGRTFTFREKECTARDYDRLAKMVDKELEEDLKILHRIDREMLIAHLVLARHLDERKPLHAQGEDIPLDVGDYLDLPDVAPDTTTRHGDLLSRYRFHMTVQPILQTMLGEQSRLMHIFRFLSENPRLNENDFAELQAALRSIHSALLDGLQKAQAVKVPALTNVESGTSLHSLIMDRGDQQLPRLTGDSITGEWLGKLATRVEGMVSRTRRVHFKSLGSLLARQERMVAEWKALEDKPAPATEPIV